MVDENFGPFFVKFCSYFLYNAKVCLNSHEYVKRQLAKRGMGFEALDNALVRCDDPESMQAIARQVTAERIDALVRKWLARLPQLVLGTVVLHELERAVAFLKLDPIARHVPLQAIQPLGTIRSRPAHRLSFIRSQEQFSLFGMKLQT